MKIQDVLAKMIKGETLTEAETKLVQEYDPQRDKDSAAAAAKKEAETKAQKLIDELTAAKDETSKRLEELEKAAKSKEDEGKTELEKVQAQLGEITKALEESNKAQEAMKEEAKAAKREVAINGLMKGIKFIDGVDSDMLTGSFAAALSTIQDEDLANEDTTKPLIDAFKERNKALLLDESKGGTGHPAQEGGGGGGGDGVDGIAKNDQDRAKQLADKRE